MRAIIIIMLITSTLSIEAQDKDGQKMNEMWGTQTELKNAKSENRAALFDQGNYSMFIHWGIYSNIANKWNGKTYYGISEWIMHPRRAGIPPKEYMAEAKNFNPINFDAKAIAKLAKDAGMKYIVVTSKHHDGFAMYDSKSNDFNIVKATPFARDPMKELSQACKEIGLGFGFYYSHNQDWTFPGGNGGPKTTEEGKAVSFDYYFKNKCLPQVQEITTEYGDIDFVWFDTPGEMEKKYVEELVAVVRKNQPGAMISGRAGHGLGDYQSLGDMNIPNENIDGLWETVDVTNDSWGYAWYDENWKSPKAILENVISTVARGGTYMLNVGPKPDGTIPVEATRFLEASGAWIKKHPNVVYNAQPSPWQHKLPWGDVTVTGNQLNLCIYEWPLGGEISVPGLSNRIRSAKVLLNEKKKKIKTSQKNGWTTFYLPNKRPTDFITVVEVNLEGAPKVDALLGVDPTFASVFPVEMAEVKSATLAPKQWMEKFGEWKHIEQVEAWNDQSEVTWELDVSEPGYYQVDLNYAGEGRTVWKVTTEEGDLVQNEQNASHIYTFFQMGLIEFKKPGKHKVTVAFVDGQPEKASLKLIKFKAVDYSN